MPALIAPALQASGELLAGLWAFTVILVSIATPVIVFLLLRFLWSRTVYIAPTPAMWAMMREWQRAALHAEHQRATEHHGDLPTADVPRHGVHLSTFGR